MQSRAKACCGKKLVVKVVTVQEDLNYVNKHFFIVPTLARSLTICPRGDELLLSIATVCSMTSSAAHSFSKLLNQPKTASKSRASGEVDDGIKKLRRMILVEGIPSAIVRYPHRPLCSDFN